MEYRRQWSERSMEMALEEVVNGKMTVRRAALEYNVPKSTLHDRVSGRVKPGAKPGPSRYLNDEEEEEIVRWIIGCAEVGYAKSVREVRAVVGAIVANKLGMPNVTISQGWWEKFCKRFPELSLRTGEAVAYRRAISINKGTIYHYFDLLENILRTNGLFDRPSLVFNADESGMPLATPPGKRVGAKGMTRVCCVSTGVKTQVTVLCCASAAGSSIPPLVIFQRANLLKCLTLGEVPGTMYGLNPESGWINGEILKEWFVRHFLVYAPAGRPLLLLLDGHKAHYNPDFIREAAKHGVIIFCLPPNTTHVSQPLDSTCFHSLKRFWMEACDNYMCSNPGKVVTIYQFSELFASAFVKAFTPRNITSSFRVTGVFPPNRKAIPIPGDIESLGCTPTANIAEKHGIEYLPFHTPRKKLEPSLNSSETLTDLPNFTDAELQLFQRRFEEGYDIKTDNRYNLWLEVYHPQPHLEPGSPSVVAAKPSTTNVKSNDDLQESSLVMISSNGSNQQYTKEKLSDYLVVPTPPGARKLPKPPKHAKVLTSAEYLVQLDEKEKEKKEKEAAREQKRIEREERKKINAAKKTKKLRAKAVQSNKARKNADGREATITYGEVESETVCFSTGNSLRTTNTTINNQEKITSQPHLSSTDSISVGNTEKRYHTRQRAVSTSDEHEAENEENAGVHVETNCSSKVCPNPRARSWIQCCLCNGWFHCTCAGVLWRDAKKDDYVYKCSSCSIVHSVS